jgi:hypothetical protein
MNNFLLYSIDLIDMTLAFVIYQILELNLPCLHFDDIILETIISRNLRFIARPEAPVIRFTVLTYKVTRS